MHFSSISDIIITHSTLLTRLLCPSNYPMPRLVVSSPPSPYQRNSKISIPTHLHPHPQLPTSTPLVRYHHRPIPTADGSSSTVSPPPLPPGVEDTLFSRGFLSVDNDYRDARRSVDHMRERGVRRVLVPSDLAYGNAG